MSIPESIRRLIGAKDYKIDAVGRSDSQVIVFDEMVLKIEKYREETENEYRMMEWLCDKLPVPKILYREVEDGINYLLMTKVEGKMCCEVEILEDPQQVAKLLAEGLKMLWSVDVSQCPNSSGIEDVLRNAEIRVHNNLCSIEDAEPETYGEGGFDSPKELLNWLKENKPTQELVFSHGDYCLPNILVTEDNVSGFIDLGRSGIADKYQDIALCYRSLAHNCKGAYGGRVYEGFDATILFDELNIIPDWNKIKYYILLDELF